MAKTINKRIRAIVLDILSQQDGKPEWKQAEHGAAISKAAFQFAQSYAEMGAEERAKVTWKTFMEDYGDAGFAGGNLSQFQQVLDDLPEDDDCHVTRPAKDAKLKNYV